MAGTRKTRRGHSSRQDHVRSRQKDLGTAANYVWEFERTRCPNQLSAAIYSWGSHSAGVISQVQLACWSTATYRQAAEGFLLRSRAWRWPARQLSKFLCRHGMRARASRRSAAGTAWSVSRSVSLRYDAASLLWGGGHEGPRPGRGTGGRLGNRPLRNHCGAVFPVARAVVESAAIRPGERVLDLGCGTGNAALLAADHSGEVTGVDPASRLLEVARARAAGEGKEVTFLHGEATSLPAGDASVDVILSVFAVIFAPDPGAAAAEMSRVLVPGGRIVLSAWIPAGAMFELNSAAAQAVRQAVGG